MTFARAKTSSSLAAALAALLCATAHAGTLTRVWLGGHRVVLARDAHYPVVSPDGRRVAFFRAGDLFVVPVEGGSEVTLAHVGGTISGVDAFAWSPDSRTVAVATGDSLLVAPLAGAVRSLTTPALAPAWAPDGRALSFPGRGVTVVTAALQRVFHVAALGAAWSRDGRLAVIEPRSLGAHIAVYAADGRLRFRVPGRDFAWAGDGRLGIARANTLDVRARDGRLLARVPVPGLHRDESNGVRWLDAQRVLVGGVDDRHARVVDLRARRVELGSLELFGDLSSRGRLAGFTASTLQVWRPGGARSTLARFGKCANLLEATAVWLPDGRSLVYDRSCENE